MGSSDTHTSSPMGGKGGRSVFTVAKDIFLLKRCLHYNPWQTDHKNWNYIAKDLLEKFDDFPPTMTSRTIRERIGRLSSQFAAEKLAPRRGATDDELMERDILLKQVVAIMEGVELPFPLEVDTELGGNLSTADSNSNGIDLDMDSEDFVETGSDLENGVTIQSLDRLKQRKQRLTPMQCGNLINGNGGISSNLTASSGSSSANDPLAPTASAKTQPPIFFVVKAPNEDGGGSTPLTGAPPLKKPKFTNAEDLVLAKDKQRYDFQIRLKQLEMEQERANNDFQLENQRLELEKAKLELEVQKESRLLEESKRRDEIQTNQLQIQNNVYQLMLKIMDHVKK